MFAFMSPTPKPPAPDYPDAILRAHGFSILKRTSETVSLWQTALGRVTTRQQACEIVQRRIQAAGELKK